MSRVNSYNACYVRWCINVFCSRLFCSAFKYSKSRW